MAVTLLAKLMINPDHFDTACAAVSAAAPLVRQEDGCVSYDFYSIDGDKSAIYAFEIWADKDALKAHGKQPHMAEMMEKLKPVLTGAPQLTMLTKIGE